MSHDYKFEGWVGHDKDCINGKLSWEEFKPKTWEEVRNSQRLDCCYFTPY